MVMNVIQRINSNYRFQDAYNLDGPDKWKLIEDLLDDEVNSRYSYWIDNIKYFEVVSSNNITSTKFNNVNNKEVLTLYLMNMARMDKDNWYKDLFDSGIEESAGYVNSRLTTYY